MLVDTFTVAENIILGKEPKKFGRIDRKRAGQEVQDISDRYGLQIHPEAKRLTYQSVCGGAQKY